VSAALVAVTVQVPEALLTFRVVPPVILQPVEAPTENVTAPVPEPPLDDRVAVVPYGTVDGVEIAVRVDWLARTAVVTLVTSVAVL
jgi:hypothetical protein